MSKIDYLKLIRLPNIFTAVSNVLAGILLTNNGNFPFPDYLYIAISSALLYGGGVALNDYCDRNYDKIYRPGRPIPSGMVSTEDAFFTIFVLMTLGIFFGFEVSPLAGIVTIILTISIIFYNTLLKKWFLSGIISMGLCRSLNWVLGLTSGNNWLKVFSIIPIIVFIYIAGITAISRYEIDNHLFRKIVTFGIVLIPLFDGIMVYIFGNFWQGIYLITLIIPIILLRRLIEMT